MFQQQAKREKKGKSMQSVFVLILELTVATVATRCILEVAGPSAALYIVSFVLLARVSHLYILKAVAGMPFNLVSLGKTSRKEEEVDGRGGDDDDLSTAILGEGSETNTCAEKGEERWGQKKECEPLCEKKQKALQALLDSHFGNQAPAEIQDKLQFTIINGDRERAALRALRARDFHIDKTREMVDNMIAWRDKEGWGTILSRPLEQDVLNTLRASLYDGFCGTCNDGCPVYIMRGGKMKLSHLQSQVGLEQIVTYHVQVMEYCFRYILPETSKRLGRTIDKVTLVFDMEGFHYDFGAGDVISRQSKIDSDVYYEWLNKAIVVNAGFFFRAFFKTITPFLPSETRKKIFVLSNKSELLQHIPDHQLPCMFGGTLDDIGAVCSEENPWTFTYKEMDQVMQQLAASATAQ